MKLKKLQALFLAIIMAFSMVMNIVPALAVGSAHDPSSLCPHHTEHTGCSYSEGSGGSPCTHIHDADCEYKEAKDEVLCDKDCIDEDDDGIIDHVEGCAYQPAEEGHECMHVHDGNCGYKAPVEPVPCNFVCPVCDCTCTSLCEDESINEECPVCSKDHANCTFTTVDIGLLFGMNYVEYGESSGTTLSVVGNINGKKVNQAQVTVSLSEEEAA